MARLLDYIFYNLAEKGLDRTQIEAYLRYLEELIRHDLPPEKEKAYRSFQVQLRERVQKLDAGPIQFTEKRKETNES